ncbi:MAG: hypothetical protein ACTHJN_15395 [Ginsengibacter sp.]
MKKRTSILRQILCFKRPKISRLNFLDLVSNQHGYFLLVWSVSNAFSITIQGNKRNTFSESGFAFVKVPDNISELRVVFRNLWQSVEEVISIKRIDFAIEYDEYCKLSKLVLPRPKTKKYKFDSFQFKVASQKNDVKSFKPAPKFHSFSINNSLLLYQSKNYSQP